MLIDKLLFILKSVQHRTTPIRIALLLLGSAMFIPKISKDKIYTDESLERRSKPEIKYINSDLEDYFEHKEIPDYFTAENSEFVYDKNGDSPIHTILILGEKSQKVQASRLLSIILQDLCLTKNVRVVLTDSTEDYQCYLFYFLVIRITFRDETAQFYNFLKPIQCNSDVFFLTKKYFGLKLQFKLPFRQRFETNVNQIHINLDQQNLNDLFVFRQLFRAVSNLHSHAYGSYFYIPFNNFHVDLIAFLPFIAVTFFISLLDSYSKRGFSVSYEFLVSFLFLITPWAFVLTIFQNSAVNAFSIIFFISVNLPFGIIYCYLIYLKNLICF